MCISHMMDTVHFGENHPDKKLGMMDPLLLLKHLFRRTLRCKTYSFNNFQWCRLDLLFGYMSLNLSEIRVRAASFFAIKGFKHRHGLTSYDCYKMILFHEMVILELKVIAIYNCFSSNFCFLVIVLLILIFCAVSGRCN